MISPEHGVLIAMATCMGGAIAVILVGRSPSKAGWWAFVVTLLSAILAFRAVGQVLLNGPSSQPEIIPGTLHFGLAFRLYIDGLSAWFLMVAAVIAVAAALYSIAYMRHYEEYGLARYCSYFLLFLAAMYGLLGTTDMMWAFFVLWQLMTIPSFALIRYEHKNPENIRAANKYLLMMELACLAIMSGVYLLVPTSTASAGAPNLRYDFDAVSANLPALLNAHPAKVALAFALFLVGFGIKMGMWPFGQLWLPDAHPAAPSPVSALLSGVMIKTGVYGLLRYFLWLVPQNSQARFPWATWGMLVAVLGTITLFTGTMQALKQEQSKRLLAFSSIGQIGYVLLGVGVCMALLQSPAGTTLAALALFGALLHVLNHALFKGLLFLNAGSIMHATGTQDLNQMGGLMKYMPLTAVTALVASFSISGVPLFNGFVSKWSIFVSAIQGVRSSRYLVVCAVIAMLTSTLTLATFIKFFGVSFLARSSALVKTRVKRNGPLEVPWTMQVPQLVLAFSCVLIGILPSIAFRLLHQVVASSPGGFGARLAHASPMGSGMLSGLAGPGSTALFVPLALVLVMAFTFLIAQGISIGQGAGRRVAEPWLCGYASENECNRYVAHNFYGEIKRYFGWVGGTVRPNKAAGVKGLP